MIPLCRKSECGEIQMTLLKAHGNNTACDFVQFSTPSYFEDTVMELTHILVRTFCCPTRWGLRLASLAWSCFPCLLKGPDPGEGFIRGCDTDKIHQVGLLIKQPLTFSSCLPPLT